MRAIWVVVRLMPSTVEDGADHVLEVLVGAGDHAGVEVAGAGGGVDLEHLGDAGEVLDDVGEAALGDLEGHEGEDARSRWRAGRRRGRSRVTTPRRCSFSRPRLYGPPGHLQLAGELHHPCPGRLGDGPQQPGVESVDPRRFHGRIV